MLTPEQLQQFREVADALYADLPELLGEIDSLRIKAGPSRDEVCRVLEAGDALDVANGHVAALEQILDAVEPVRSIAEASGRGYASEALGRADEDAPAVDPQRLLAEGRAALHLALPLMEFCTAGAYLSVYGLLNDYVDLSEAFLGRTPGSKQVAQRALRVFATAVKELAGTALTGMETLLELLRQIVTSPLDRDIKDMQKATALVAKIHILREAHAHMRAHTEVAGVSITRSVVTAQEERRVIDASLRAIAQALASRPTNTTR